MNKFVKSNLLQLDRTRSSFKGFRESPFILITTLFKILGYPNSRPFPLLPRIMCGLLKQTIK